MRKKVLLLGLCGTLLLGTGLTAMAAQGEGRNGAGSPRWGKGKACRMEERQDHLGRLLERLDLSEEQRKEVEKLTEAQREKAAGMRKQMVDLRREMRQAMNPKNFDEKALRRLAADKAKIQTELMVSRARTHSQIYALLTPEQQELADLARNLKRLRGQGARGFRDCPNPMGPAGPRVGDWM